MSIDMKPDDLYSFLARAAITSPKLWIIDGDEGALKMRLAKMDKDLSECYVDLAISYNGTLSDLHFTAASPEYSERLANAVAYVVLTIFEHLHRVNVWDSDSTMAKATNADLARIAAYLQKCHVATIDEICRALGMKGLIAVLSVKELVDRGVLGMTTDNPHKFFFK